MPELADLISQWPVASFLRQSLWAYPLTNAVHIMSLGLLLGAITTLDLRLLGLFAEIPLVSLARPLVHVARAGLVMALLSGLLLFCVQASHYLGNTAFQIKLLLVALVLANVALVHRLPAWQLSLQDNVVRPSLKAAASLSLLLWLLVILAGRWVAFV